MSNDVPPPHARPTDPPSAGVPRTGQPGVEGHSRDVAQKDALRGSKASAGWIFAVGLLVLIILLAIFVLQNTQRVHVSFLGFDGRAPLAAVTLIAAAAGLLIAVVAGGTRILQLRRRVKRERRR